MISSVANFHSITEKSHIIFTDCKTLEKKKTPKYSKVKVIYFARSFAEQEIQGKMNKKM